ncbi:MAG: lysoplasmalogenase, partial [Clostridiales bacterium]|nr:lysoplasmalogenase [Clostridiales bacterium]
MNLYWIVLAAGIAATLIFLYLRVKKGGVTGLIAKAVASVGFIATACAALSLNIGFYGYGLLVIVGLVCGLLGDIWLDLKWIYIQDKDTYLYAGMASFFVGHIFFITAILTHFNWAVINILIALAIAVAGAVIVLLIEKPMKMDYGKFKIPSAM